jgi:stage II sporulation protein D
MDLEEYLIGVLAMEVPALFEIEALKAQAIVARTYTVKRMRCFGGQGSKCHPEADMCDDPTHGQGWMSEGSARARWPALDASRNWSRLASAVSETNGLIIAHRGLPIDPVYHSTCGGATENSEDVWSAVVPYLRSVTCDWCRSSPRYRSTIQMAIEDMGRRLGEPVAVPALARREGRKFIEILKISGAGRAQTVRIGDRTLKGVDFRSALGLASTKFGWRLSGSSIVFECDGYGHGVGLCQYGANGMAKEGSKASEIIRYYFSGTSVMPMFETR